MSEDRVGSRRSSSAAPKDTKEHYKQGPATFAGWISEEWGIAWVVSKARRDKRTGVIPKEPVEPAKVYLLQYEIRAAGQHKAQARFQGIAAADPAEAVKKAHAFMDEIGLGPERREGAQLFYNESRLTL